MNNKSVKQLSSVIQARERNGIKNHTGISVAGLVVGEEVDHSLIKDSDFPLKSLAEHLKEKYPDANADIICLAILPEKCDKCNQGPVVQGICQNCGHNNKED